jgi:hypothetical protein
MKTKRNTARLAALPALSPLCTAALLCSAWPATAQDHKHDAHETSGKVLMLGKDLEPRLAVNALPPHLRDGAGIWLLADSGYVKAKDATNAFTCIVSRRGGNLYPVCFDEEGTRTILPAFMDDAMLRLKGETPESVERILADGFQSGKYRPPSRPGISYMLSPATYMMQGGKLTRTIAHTMFYAPFLTDGDIGGAMGKSPFVDRPGPHGMIIVPAGQKEREAGIAQNQALIDEVEKVIGLKP